MEFYCLFCKSYEFNVEIIDLENEKVPMIIECPNCKTNNIIIAENNKIYQKLEND